MTEEPHTFGVGQEVVVESGHGYSRAERLAKVEKITPAGKIRVSGVSAMFGPDGRGPRPNSPWEPRSRIVPVTPEWRAKAKLQAAQRRIASYADALSQRAKEVVTAENAAEVEAFLKALLPPKEARP